MVAHTENNGPGLLQEEDANDDDATNNDLTEDDTRNDHNVSTPSHPPSQSQHFPENPRPMSDVVEADFDVDDNFEMVMSLKCRYCSFLTQDKPTLVAHIRHHLSGGGSGNGRRRQKSSNNAHNINSNTADPVQEDMGNGGFDVSKIKTNKREIGKEEIPPIPSIPPTPEAYFIMSDEDDEDSCQLLPETLQCDGRPNGVNISNNDQSSLIDGDPLDMDDVFLCAECDIVFASKELCCRHMHDIHGLEQFSAEFIQEVIISKRPGEEGENVAEDEEEDRDSRLNGGENTNSEIHHKTDTSNLRKRINPPNEVTLENGSLVPKKFRVSKNPNFFCSKCFAKYESEEVMKLHEACHIGRDDDSNTEYESCNNGTRRNGKLQRTSHQEEQEDEDSELRLEEEEDESGSSFNSLKKEEGKNPEGGTEYKFKCSLCLSGTKPRETGVGGGESIKIAKLFTKWSNCASHLWREHQVDCELYSCTMCKKFKNYYITKVKDHEQLHKPETNYICNTCNKKFKQRHQLTTHQKYHKEKGTRLPPTEESRWYTPKECPICKRVLSDAKCLKKHISAVHNKLKPYCCNICGHMTARKAELRLHIRQHSGEKPFKCDQCQFATGDHNSLRNHKLRHGNQRPYSCPYCEYRCIQSSAFKKHLVSIHPEQNVIYQCQICPHASVNEALASAHTKDHEEGRIGSSSRRHSHHDEDSTENPGQNHEDDDSSNDYPEIGIRSFGRRRPPPVRKPRSPQKPRWLEDDSVDVIDTGGVTIPASPVSPPLPEESEPNLNSGSASSSNHKTILMDG